MSRPEVRSLEVIAARSRGYDQVPDAAGLSDWIAAGRYHGYAYAYPHKTAYRALAAPAPLESVWSAERRDALALYVHVPFCESLCYHCTSN